MIIPQLENVEQRVLVLAPFGRDAALLTRVFHQASIPAETCIDIATLCDRIQAGVGAVLVAGEALTTAGMQLLRDWVDAQDAWSDLPIFVMTRAETERRTRLKHLEPLGNVTLLERPLRGETLVSAFRMGLRSRAHQYQLRERLAAERRVTHALRESERWYRVLAEAMPPLVWTCTADGNCDYLSRQLLDYTGAPEGDQLGFGWMSHIHPDDREATNRAWRTACATGVRYEVEYRLRHNDGRYRWFKTQGVPVHNSDGDVQKWFGACTDIEDQKQVSEERRDLLAREQKARGLSELLNRVGPMLLEELDSSRLAQSVTDLATQLSGAQFGALFQNQASNGEAHHTLQTFSGVSRSTFEKFTLAHAADVVASTFDDGKCIVSDDILQDTRFGRQPNGSLDGLSVRSYLAMPVISRSGNVIGSLVFGSGETGAFKELHVKLAEGIAAQAAIAIDNARLFAEAQQAQETLRRSNTDLQHANEDLNQFAYSASHDLQEPLRMVALYSQMFERKYRHLLDAQGAEYLNFMVQGAQRMEALLTDLRDYTQAFSSQDEAVEETDLKLVLEQVVQGLVKSISESGASVIGRNLPLVAVKQVHVYQLLQNLIGNALKYRGTDTPNVLVSAQPEGAMWRISVSDNGIGIAPQYRRQVFGLFKRLHVSSQYEGTGIGLAICQKIVERYSGRIWVESDGEGKGSTFWFTLPGVGQN